MLERHHPSETPSLASVIVRLAAALSSEEFSTGDRAALRRMQPTQHPPLAFYKFAMYYLPDNWEYRQADWVTITAGMALMAPEPHDFQKRFGTVLADEGFSEARLERLLVAEGDVRRVLLLRAARFLAAKNSSVNWLDCTLFLLLEDEKKREDLHRRIAKDYYDQLFLMEKREGVS